MLRQLRDYMVNDSRRRASGSCGSAVTVTDILIAELADEIDALQPATTAEPRAIVQGTSSIPDIDREIFRGPDEPNSITGARMKPALVEFNMEPLTAENSDRFSKMGKERGWKSE